MTVKDLDNMKFIADFFMTLAAKTSHGVKLPEAVDQAAECSKRGYISFTLIGTEKLIHEGKLAEALAQKPSVFPPFIPEIIRAAECQSQSADDYRFWTVVYFEIGQIINDAIRLHEHKGNDLETGSVLFYSILGKAVQWGCDLETAVRVASIEYLPEPMVEEMVSQTLDASISYAMQKHPWYFNPMDCGTMVVAERQHRIPIGCHSIVDRLLLAASAY